MAQSILVTTTPVECAVFGPNTRSIRVSCEQACWMSIPAVTPDAATTGATTGSKSIRVAGGYGWPQFFEVMAGEKFSIRADATTGYVNIVEYS